MRIGFFTSVTEQGGSEMYLLRLMRGMRERGHTPVLFGVGGAPLTVDAAREGIHIVKWKHVTPQAANEHPSVSATTSSGLPSCIRSCIRSVAAPVLLLAGSVREVIQLRRLIAATPVDVMHINVHGYEVAGVSCRLLNVPCVGVYCISPVSTDWLRAILIRASAAFYTLCISKSPIPMQAWQDQYGVTMAGWIRNGIDVDQYVNASKARRWDGPLHVLAAGRLDWRKGFGYLIEAVAKQPEGTVHLKIAGEGTERERLEGLVSRYRLRDSVTLLGEVSDMANVYADSHCFADVTFEDWSGSVVLEAMSSGIPVIASSSDVVRSGETGWVCPFGNVNALASVLENLVARAPAERRCLGMAAQTYAQSHFSNARMLAQTEDLYKKALSGT